MTTIADTLIERGIQRGMQQGIQQGILQNAQERVIEILEVRFEEGQSIIAMTVEKGTQKPYYLIKNGSTLCYIRVGTTCRLASPEQIAVLYASHPMVHYDVSPVPETRSAHECVNSS